MTRGHGKNSVGVQDAGLTYEGTLCDFSLDWIY